MPPESSAAKVRLRLSTSMAGPKISYKPGDIITVDADEAQRHLANGNGTIVEGPLDETELQKLRVENAQLRSALASPAAAAPVPSAKK